MSTRTVGPLTSCDRSGDRPESGSRECRVGVLGRVTQSPDHLGLVRRHQVPFQNLDQDGRRAIGSGAILLEPQNKQQREVNAE